eukprot:scpid99699/ scgid30396/ Ribonuclease P protein subunit p21; Ribonucleoprotein V
MGKNKSKGSLPHREAYLRMNFLHQASNFMTSECSQVPEARELSRHYNSVMKTVARRLVLRLDCSIKRGICKACHTSLATGDCSSVRVQGKRRTHVVVTCKTCGAIRRYRATPEKASDRPVST